MTPTRVKFPAQLGQAVRYAVVGVGLRLGTRRRHVAVAGQQWRGVAVCLLHLDAPPILHLLVEVLKPHVFSSSTTCIRKASPVAAQLSTLATVRAPVWWWTPCFG